MEIDRISYLPENVIDQILMRLPINDAARTSVLSRCWRYKFAELPYLTFSCPQRPLTPESKIVSTVDHILMLHIGPILKVRLEWFNDYDALHRWILYLSRSSTKEFEILVYDFDYRLPPSFYAWQNLTALLCYRMSLAPPSQFAGFAKLKSLKLQFVQIEGTDLENLIVGCPVLERLTIDTCSELNNVKITAPNLKFLYLRNAVEFLSFENTRCLAQVFLHSHSRRPALLESGQVFAQLPGIRFLDVDFCFLKYLTTGIDPGKVPILCESLECLGIRANLNNQADCLRARCLFIICPNITELTIKPRYNFIQIASVSCEESCFWNQDIGDPMFTKLQYVEIIGVSETKLELDFIEFVLLNSPVLERIVIRPASKSIQLGLLKILATFRRISARARIMCLDW